MKFVNYNNFSRVESLLLLFAKPNLHFVKTNSNLNSKVEIWLDKEFILSSQLKF